MSAGLLTLLGIVAVLGAMFGVLELLERADKRQELKDRAELVERANRIAAHMAEESRARAVDLEARRERLERERQMCAKKGPCEARNPGQCTRGRGA